MSYPSAPASQLHYVVSLLATMEEGFLPTCERNLESDDPVAPQAQPENTDFVEQGGQSLDCVNQYKVIQWAGIGHNEHRSMLFRKNGELLFELVE